MNESDPIRKLLTALFNDGYGVNDEAYKLLRNWLYENNKDIFDNTIECKGRHFALEETVKGN